MKCTAIAAAAAIVAALASAIPCAAAGFASPLANGGFEDGGAGWNWMAIAMATIAESTAEPHSGQKCLVFTNESEVAPNVYARLHQRVQVRSGQLYELSAWARGREVRPAQHFTDWSTYTLNLPDGTFDWKRVSTTFTTGPAQETIEIGLNLVDRIGELALDDVTLRAIGAGLEGKGVKGSVVVTRELAADNAPAEISAFVDAERDDLSISVEASFDGRRLYSNKAKLQRGEQQVDWSFDSGRTGDGEILVSVQVEDASGSVVAGATDIVNKKISPAARQLEAVEKRKLVFDRLFEQCRRQGVRLDYPSVTKTMLDEFIPYARHDLAIGQQRKAEFAVRDFNRSLDDSIREMKLYLARPELAPLARRFATGRVRVDGLSFIGDSIGTDGNRSSGPVFFTGYGHFGQVRADVPRFPAWGVNLIQIETGPAFVLKSEDETDLAPALEIASVLDRAAKSNVRVDVLVSPHYFPGWAFQKWPDIGKGGGNPGFCVDLDGAKQVMERYLRAVIPVWASKPALNSICITNEPNFSLGHGCPDTLARFRQWLKGHHRTVGALNSAWGRSYGSFEDVPMQGISDSGYSDYCSFNEERFAGWHEWMAGIVHELAPGVPVHAKIQMEMATFSKWYHNVSWGVDPELFGRALDLNGNDCIILPSSEASMDWTIQNIMYDVQRTANRKPIFNSENHPTHDGATYYVRPGHFRTALWQGAVHGQGATTIWVWERSDDPGSTFYGNVMDRPGCAEAVGRTGLDLMRFGRELTALQNVKASAAILWSLHSNTRNTQYVEGLKAAYSVLNWSGIKIDLVTERQLAKGRAGDYRLLIVPDGTRPHPETLEALASLAGKTKLVVIGDACTVDAYGKRVDTGRLDEIRQAAVVLDGKTPLWKPLRQALADAGALGEWEVLNAATGEPVSGVEWLPALVGSRRIVNFVNLNPYPVTVEVRLDGKQVRLRDLLSPGGLLEVHRLLPMTPALGELIP